MSTTAAATENKYKQTERALILCGWTFVALAAAVLLCAIGLEITSAGRHGRILLAVIATIGASLFGGALLGLLFGIPAVGPNDAAPPSEEGGDTKGAGDARSRLTANDSLVRVSQWLTTIIVGLSIAEFDKVVAGIQQIGTAVAGAVFCAQECSVGAAGAISGGLVATGAAAVIAFSVNGFLLSYLWTRVYLPRELLQSELDALNLSRPERQARKDGLVQERPASALDASAAAPSRQQQRTEVILKESTALEGSIAPGANPDDPWKGVFGGQPAANGFTLSATVERSKENPDFFVVDVTCGKGSTAPDAKRVTFYLHPTFPTPKRKRTFKGGQAAIPLLAYGAFTVGAMIDDGTRLELDLSQLPDAPEEFRSR